MNHIKNMIVPTCTSSASEPDVFGGFVANFNGFHVYYDANLDNEKLLIFSSKSLYFSNYKDGVFAAQVGKEWFIVEDGNLRPLKDDSFVQGKSSQVLGGFAVTEFGRWGYRFVNIESGEEKLFEERRHHIVDVRNDAFYVKKLSEPQALLKLNENFALIESYGFDGQSIVFEQHLNNYLFYVISGTPLYLEVFDLDKFEVVSERKEVQGSILQVFQSEGVFHVFVGGELFLWDGINLKKQNFSKEISAFLAKDNFFYIGFKQDPNVYGFQSATLKPLGRKQIGIDGYHPWSFSKSGAQNVVTLRNSSLPYINRFEYMAVWSDQEYFSDDLWVVTLESTIYEERKSLDGDNFGVSIQVNAEHDYIKIVRQGMAAVDDAISRHAVSIVPSSKDRPYSNGFNGQVEVVFEKAKNLDANQRKQLTQGMEKIQADYEIAFKGFANGKLQPIEVEVFFKG